MSVGHWLLIIYWYLFTGRIEGAERGNCQLVNGGLGSFGEVSQHEVLNISAVTRDQLVILAYIYCFYHTWCSNGDDIYICIYPKWWSTVMIWYMVRVIVVDPYTQVACIQLLVIYTSGSGRWALKIGSQVWGPSMSVIDWLDRFYRYSTYHLCLDWLGSCFWTNAFEFPYIYRDEQTRQGHRPALSP